MFFNLFLSSLLHRSFSDVLYPSMISYLIYQNSKTRYLHAPHINLYLYYYFSYFIQVINHFASFLYSALLIKQGPLNFVGNSVNSELCFSELYSNQPKSEIYPKMPMFERLQKQVPVNSKKNLIPYWKDLDMNFSGL